MYWKGLINESPILPQAKSSSDEEVFMKKVMIGILLMVFNMNLGLGQDNGTDPLQRHLFSAESIMRNQRELQLDQEQRSYMVKQIQETQSEFTSLQWQLQDEVGRLS